MTTRTDGTCDQNSRVILDPYAPGPSPRAAAPWLSPAVLSVPQSTLPWPGATHPQVGMKTEPGVKIEPSAYHKGPFISTVQGQVDQTSVFGHCQPTGMPDDLMNMNSRRYLQLLDQHPHAAHSNPQAAHPLMPPLGAARFWDMGCYFGSHTPAMAHSSAGVGPHVAPAASRMSGYDGHIIGLGSIATNVLHHPVSAAGAVVDNHHHMATGLPPPPPAHPAAHAATHHASHLGATHAALAPPPPPPPPHIPVCSSAVSVSLADTSVSNLKFYPGVAASAAVAASVAASVSHASEPSGSGPSSAAADNSSVASSRQPQPQQHPSSTGPSQQLPRPPHQPTSAAAKRQPSSSAASSAAAAAVAAAAAASSAAASTGGDANGMLGAGAERPFICETCNKGFTKEHHLKTHKRIHTGERPYGCDVCGKAFSKAYHLKRHKSIHTGERPFVCEDCGKAFSEAYYLKRHRSIHSGERPHACESCGKSFSKAYYLKRHQTIHTGERRQFYNMWSKGGASAVPGGGPSSASGSGAAAGGPPDPGVSSGSPLGRKPTMAVPLSLVGASATASNDVAAAQRPV